MGREIVLSYYFVDEYGDCDTEYKFGIRRILKVSIGGIEILLVVLVNI